METQEKNNRVKSQLRRETGLAALLLLLVINVLILPILGNPIENVLGWPFCDMPASYYPWREWGFSQILSGHFPFWNHHTFCGNPFAANFETALFYPLNWPLFLLLPTSLALNLSIILHLWMGGFFTYLLARKLNLNFLPALLSAIGFCLCGPMVARIYAGHITIISTLAWFPILLLFAEKLMHKPSRRTIFLAPLCFGLSALAGHPQVLYYNSLFLLLFCVLRLALMFFVEKRRATELFARVCRLGFMVVFGIGLAAVQIFLTYQMQRFASRQNFTLEVAGTYSLSPKSLAGVLLPGIFGNGQSGPFWGPWYQWEIAVFPGLVILILGLSFPMYLLFFRPDKREDIFELNRSRWCALMIPSIIFFLTGLGLSTPVFPMLYHIIPAFDSFRGLSRIYGQVFLVLCLSAGAALQIVLNCEECDRKKVLLPIIAVSLSATAAAGYIVYHLSSESTLGLQGWLQSFVSNGSNISFVPETFRHPVVVGAVQDQFWREAFFAFPIIVLICGIILAMVYIPRWKYVLAAILLLVCVADLYRAHVHFVATFPVDKVVDAVELPTDASNLINERVFIDDPGISANNALLRDYLTPDGYEPLYPRRYGEWMNAWLQKPRKNYQSVLGPFTPQLCSALGTTRFIYPVDKKTYQQKNMKNTPTFSPRAFIAYEITYASTPEQAWSLIQDRKSKAKVVIEVEGESAAQVTTTTLSAAKIIRQTPSSLKVSVTNPQGGYLILLNNWHPGWKAYIDNREIPIHHAQYAFQAVAVPESPEKEIIVEFRYFAPGFRLGLIVSIVSLCVILAGLVIIPRKKSEFDSR